MLAIMLGDQVDPSLKRQRPKNRVARWALPLIGSQHLELLEQLKARLQIILKDSAPFLFPIATLLHPAVGILGGEKRVFLVQDPLKARQGDLFLHVSQVGKHFQGAPFFGI
jgi:hypothetical protein